MVISWLKNLREDILQGHLYREPRLRRWSQDSTAISVRAVEWLEGRQLLTATITAATGGTALTDLAYHSLGNIVITEGVSDDIPGIDSTSKTLILTAPTGWAFNTAAGSVSNSGSPNDINSSSILVSASTLTVALNFDSTPMNKTDVVTISGLQIRATSTSAADGNILRTVASPGTLGVIVGVTNGSTNFGSLSLEHVAPVFTSLTTATAKNENSGAHQVVYTAAATDAGTVTYSFGGGTDDALFTIVGSTGVVTLTANPNYEGQSSYSFDVKATDAAGNSTTQTVTLAINNLDEVAPVFTSGTTASVNENVAAATLVYTAAATDTGDAASAGVTYSLKAVDDFAAFTITGDLVTINASPDFETKSSYSFTVLASDGVNPATEQTVTLAINNLDEVAPVFTSGTTASVNENVAAATLVYTAATTDTGDAASAGVTYNLKAVDDFADFTITGDLVTINASPDFETKSSYSFTVLASDGVNPATERAVTLSITNLDEVAPVFTSGTTASVNENVAAATLVYTAAATDTGDAASAGVTYSLKAVDDFAAFTITGDLVTINASPDFETKSSYSFTVLASDGVNPATEQTVTLAINNLDEVAPVFTSGTTASVNENVAAATLVYTAAATDTGDAASAGVTYNLKAVDDFADFTITGDLVTINASPDFETKSSYSFTVLASDGVNPATERAVTLSITNLDEVAPVFTSGTTASVNENVAAATLVYTAAATDTGDAASAGVTYSLKAVDDFAAFTITGDLVTINASPDFETKSSYSFTVLASDGVNPATERAVTLSITNLDEVAPVFTSGTTASVNENVSAATLVYTAAATDTGDAASAGVTYSLKAVDDFAAFTITGDLVTINASPDFETKSSYSFTVLASDGVNPATERAVTLSITNINEAALLATVETTSLPYAPGAAATVITSILSLTDVDSINMAGAVVDIAAGYQVGDTLAFTDTGTITGVWDGAGKLILSGADTVANYEAALRTVTYVSSSSSPAARTLSFTVNDGTSDSNNVRRTVGGYTQLVGTTLNVYGTSVADTITVTHATFLTVAVNSVSADFTPASVTAINIYGYAGNDTITVDQSVTVGTTLRGGVGSDTLTGGGGDDKLYGGPGNDRYMFGTATAVQADSVFEYASQGTDTLVFTALTTDVNVKLGSSVIQSVHTNRTLKLNSGMTFENATGGSGNDGLTGNSLNNILIGGDGNDLLGGNAGDDMLYGGLGDDRYSFGTATAAEADRIFEYASQGSDTLVFAALTTGVNVSLGSNVFQSVHTNRTLKLNSGVTFENVTGGSGNDILIGNSLNNILIGGDGNDLLGGNAGDDMLYGGLGDDRYSFGTATAAEADRVFEYASQGSDTLVFAALTTGVNVSLGSNVFQSVHTNRTLKLNSGVTFENVTGGSGNDILIGNSLNNALTGNTGNDVLAGGGGDDNLKGGDGRNILIGGVGADILTGGTNEDLLIGARYTYEFNMTMLAALRTEWTSLSSFSDRVGHLLGTTAGGPNGTIVLTPATVKEDAAKDRLIGGNGNKDWYLRNSVGAVVTERDTVFDTDLDNVFTNIHTWL